MAALQNTIDQIQNTSAEESYDRTGITKPNNNTPDTIKTLALDTTLKLIAYAKKKQQPRSAERNQTLPNPLKQMRDTAKTPAHKGGIKIKTLNPGPYTVTIPNPATPQSHTIYITNNQLTTLKTTLNKITRS